jgi:hypothetical protein
MPNQVVKAGFDFVSVGLILGTLVDALPKIAAGVSICWYLFLIYNKLKDKDQ